MKDNRFKKWMLPIGVVAATTIPFVSVISCNSGNDNNGGDGSQTPPTDGGNDGNQESSKELLNHTNTFEYKKEDGLVEYPYLLLDFEDWFEKIKNNEVKWFNEKGDPIIYELDINIEPGLITGEREADVNAPQDFTIKSGYSHVNYWKKNDSPIRIKWEFWKKEDNNSIMYSDFYLKVTSDYPYILQYIEKDSSKVSVSLPMNAGFAVAEVEGDNIKNSTLKTMDFAGISHASANKPKIYLDGLFQRGDNEDFPWEKMKYNFSVVDGFNNNFVVTGLKNQEKTYPRFIPLYSNVIGTLSIKPKK